MCTVSVVPHAGGMRVIGNRDEQRARPPALAPRVMTLGRRRAVLPIDPVGGGSWIAVNDAALVLALLNRSDPPAAARGAPRSRGWIVRALIGCGGLDEVVSAAAALDPRMYAPFRLLALQHGRMAIVSSSGTAMTRRVGPLGAPLCLASSSLGDRLVEPPRRQLFEQLVVPGRGCDRLVRQRAFHRHRWADRPAISVVMRRAEACTVSRTTIDVTAGGAAVRYEPLAPGGMEGDATRCFCG